MDKQEIDSFLHTEEIQVPSYQTRENLNFNDINQGSYSNQILFDGMTAKNSWNVWADAYVVVPIDVRSSNPAQPYTSSSVIGFKDGGSCNFISGISIGDENNTWIN